MRGIGNILYNMFFYNEDDENSKKFNQYDAILITLLLCVLIILGIQYLYHKKLDSVLNNSTVAESALEECEKPTNPQMVTEPNYLIYL